MSNIVLRENAATRQTVDPLLSCGCGGGGAGGGGGRIQRTLEMPPDFSMTNHRLSQCRAVGNRPLCLYEAVSGRNAGFSRGGDRKGESMITPTPFRFMVKTEGLLWMHVRGLVEHRPSTLGLPKQMFSQTTPCYSLHPSLSFFVSLSLPSYGKVDRSSFLQV